MLVLRLWMMSSLLWLSIPNSFADYLPQNTTVPGGIAILPIQSPNQPMVYFAEKRVPVLADPKHPQQWLAIVGLPLRLSSGEQSVTITNPVRQQQSFIINPLPKALPAPDPILSDQAQAILSQQQKIIHIANQYSATNPFAQPFIPPMRGTLLNKFGSLVDEIPQQHIAIAAPVGTQVIAPTNAVVLAIKSLPLLGKTVFLDHGQSVITAYSQLTKLQVTPGQYIAQGKPIGYIKGLPGEVMGVLIWHGLINQALINPQRLLDPKITIDPCG